MSFPQGKSMGTVGYFYAQFCKNTCRRSTLHFVWQSKTEIMTHHCLWHCKKPHYCESFLMGYTIAISVLAKVLLIYSFFLHYIYIYITFTHYFYSFTHFHYSFFDRTSSSDQSFGKTHWYAYQCQYHIDICIYMRIDTTFYV